MKQDRLILSLCRAFPKAFILYSLVDSKAELGTETLRFHILIPDKNGMAGMDGGAIPAIGGARWLILASKFCIFKLKI